VLKKAGIIVAAVATGVLAVSSVAFADTSTGNLKNDCAFGNAGGSPAAIADQGSSLFGGVLGAVTSIAADATTQTNTANCNNLNITDVIDQDSNNKTKETTKTMIEDSFNQDN
jgi:hypothetical protein